VNAAHENAGIIRAYFKNQLGWDSIDGNAMDMLVNVHYLVRYNNAFWDGEEMTFGDGDGVNFSGFARALDVSGHEIAHGVIQFTSGLVYKGQSGALNEHFADVFGVAIQQFHLKQTAKTTNWLVGESVLIGKHKGKAIRSMKTPSDPAVVLMPQPDHMDKIYNGKDDNGGVHINSGIPNKAFLFGFDGGRHSRGNQTLV
ncbi:MAG: M4 family metallopeptidase, partial [Saprospiraceae bacterium]|nr:M4 family metallopeptidase [Saprospiraceae bacterium]